MEKKADVMKFWKQIVTLAVLILTVSVGGFAVNIVAEDESVDVNAGDEVSSVLPKSSQVKSDHTLRILAIGNSFTNDTMRFVSKIANSAGYDVTVGVLWKGSVALCDHLRYIQNDEPEYQFDQFTSENGYERVTQENIAPSTVLKKNWDLVFLQQISHLSGEPSSYYDAQGNSYVTQLIQQIRAASPNPELSFSWLMGWAYAQDFGGTSFSRYNNDQLTMYHAITDTVKNTVWSTGEFESVIPVGTSVQNVRSSYVGDHMNRDGRHLSYGMGRYTAGMTVAAAVGINLADVTYRPNDTTNVSDLHWPMLREAVSSAVLHPFETTPSTFTQEPSHDSPKLRDVAATSDGTVLSWKGVAHAATYYVTRRATGGEWSCVKSVPTMGTGAYYYTDSSAKDGTEYEYCVKAHFDSNLSQTYSTSDIVCWMGRPKKLKCVRQDEALQINGKASTAATEYRVRYSTASNMKNAKVISISATELPIKVTGLKPNTKYYMQVRQRKHTQTRTYHSKWSKVVCGTTSKYLARVKGVDCTAQTKSIAVCWSSGQKVERYEIRYSKKKNMAKSKRITVNATKNSKVIRSLENNTRYYLQVRSSASHKGKTYHSRWSNVTACTIH